MFRTMSEVDDLTHEYLQGSNQHLRDIGRLHEGSVVKYEGEFYNCDGGCYYSSSIGEVLLCVYNCIGEEGIRGLIPFREVDNSFPEVGYYNISHSGPRKAIMINRRVNSRAWRYGFHPSIADVSTPYLRSSASLMDSIMEDVPPAFRGSSRSIDRYLAADGEFHPFHAAYSSIRTGRSLSVAISRDVAIASSPMKDEVGIFLMGTRVGTVDKNGEIQIELEWATDSIMEVCND